MSAQAIASKNKSGTNVQHPSLAPHGNWTEYDRTSYLPGLGIYNHVNKVDGQVNMEAPDAGLHCGQFVINAKAANNLF